MINQKHKIELVRNGNFYGKDIYYLSTYLWLDK